MNRDEALAFLREHRPMPPDREVTKGTIEKYDQARRFFLANPDIACVRPFLQSFGDGDGLGVYQLVGDVLRRLPRQEVIEGIEESLMSGHRSVRYWNAQLAAEFPSPRLVTRLLGLLKEDDHDLKYAALTAIEQSADASAVPDLEGFLRAEQNDELRTLAREVADRLRTK
jgi:hypothetical protein